MKCPKCRTKIDLKMIPEQEFSSEHGRRVRAKVKNPSGGVVWGHHNAAVNNCRCVDCNAARWNGEVTSGTND